MKIKEIVINNIKGIATANFSVDLNPNKPSILVAPNGFGKTSFGIAFQSLGRDKISLNEKNLHNNDSANIPSLELLIQNGSETSLLVANYTQNQIHQTFDIFVINSQLIAKAKKNRIGGNVIVKSSLEVAPIVLVSTIPKKVDFEYKLAIQKSVFGSNKKILPDISEIFNSFTAVWKISNEVGMHKFGQVRISKSLNDLKKDINSQSGNAQTIKDWILNSKITELEAITEFKKLADIIKGYNFAFSTHSVDCYLAAFQVISIYQTLGANFKNAVKYLGYLSDKRFYEKIISDYNTTRYDIKPKEDKKLGLIVEWPKAHEISNGQRDVLSFITLLMQAKRNFRKDNCIMVIDEIFDYLDDANLISFQYFITDMIEEMKTEGKNFFPILMTHLDPLYFNHFCFNRHRLKVVYLKDMPYSSNPNIARLIRNREDASIKTNVDKYFFHYHTDSVDISTQFSSLGLPVNWGKSERFHEVIANEVSKYLKDQTDYDPIAICFGVRVKIEELLFSLITGVDKQTAFLEKHGTKKKLDYCDEIGVEVPETYYLLGIIYNDNLHIRNNVDIARPIAAKLENLTIKKMVRNIFS